MASPDDINPPNLDIANQAPPPSCRTISDLDFAHARDGLWHSLVSHPQPLPHLFPKDFDSIATMTRKLSLVVFLWAAVLALGQKPLECTREVAASDECADVINPAACYNQFRWNSRTLSCIDATSDAERKRKVSSSNTRLAVAITGLTPEISYRPASAVIAWGA